MYILGISADHNALEALLRDGIFFGMLEKDTVLTKRC